MPKLIKMFLSLGLVIVVPILSYFIIHISVKVFAKILIYINNYLN